MKTDEIVKNEVILWKDLISTLTYQRSPRPAMLSDHGFVTATKKGSEYYLVKYDRSYVVHFICGKIIRSLGNVSDDVLNDLFDEAITLSASN